MPAVTTDNILALPRVNKPDAMAPERKIRSVTTAPQGYEGEGFPVRRAFHGVELKDLDPFIHLDQMGEVHYAPGEPKGTPWHPHRGFETVTYMLDGTLQHYDSHGGGGLVTDGDTQWMTAGSGLLHIETPPEEVVMAGGLFHGFQLWVNLPAKQKWNEPRYQDIKSQNVELVSSHDGGTLLRLIAGNVAGHEGPGSTYTPITLIHATLEPGAELTIPWNEQYNALAYVLNGKGHVTTDRTPIGEGQLAVFGSGQTLTLSAGERQDGRAGKMDVLLLGGQPIREPVAWYGPFVMNHKAELVEAYEDFQKGKLGTIPALHDVGNIDID